MDEGTLNPSMLMIIAVWESEYASPIWGRVRRKISNSHAASKNMSGEWSGTRVGETPKEATQRGCSWAIWAVDFDRFIHLFLSSIHPCGSVAASKAIMPFSPR